MVVEHTLVVLNAFVLVYVGTQGINDSNSKNNFVLLSGKYSMLCILSLFIKISQFMP